MINLLQHNDSNLIALLYILSIFSNVKSSKLNHSAKDALLNSDFFNKKWWLLFKAKKKFPNGRRLRPGWLVPLKVLTHCSWMKYLQVSIKVAWLKKHYIPFNLFWNRKLKFEELSVVTVHSRTCWLCPKHESLDEWYMTSLLCQRSEIGQSLYLSPTLLVAHQTWQDLWKIIIQNQVSTLKLSQHWHFHWQICPI